MLHLSGKVTYMETHSPYTLQSKAFLGVQTEHLSHWPFADPGVYEASSPPPIVQIITQLR